MRIERPHSVFKNSRLAVWLRSPIKKFGKSEDGVTAVEFGLIALPFFAILMAIIEAGLYFFVSQVMDTGFRDVARQIRTGQAAMMSQADFGKAVCDTANQSSGLFNCENFYADKKILSTYNDASANLPIDHAGNFDDSQVKDWDYACGGKVVQVRAFYEWPSYANILGSSIANGHLGLRSGNILLNSTAVFRTEPFGGCAP